jgi:carbamoyltransferase
MVILGLHFGHDAGVAVLRDGALLAYVMRERHSRIKHAISLEFETIELALSQAGLTLAEVDHCAITSTQSIELIIDAPERFSVTMQRHPLDAIPSLLVEMVEKLNVPLSSLHCASLLSFLYDPAHRGTLQYNLYREFFPEHEGRQREYFRPIPWVDQYIGLGHWHGMGLAALAASNPAAQLDGQPLCHGYHLPVSVVLDGHSIPGTFVSHHMAHAASSYYASRFAQAAILTHDGFCNGEGDLSGLFAMGRGHRIFPLAPHHLAMGAFYELVGVALNLGPTGAPGKLMGLASYGQPRFFDPAYVGNWHDWQARGVSLASWSDHCLKLASQMGYDLAPLADRSQMTEAVNADIAASVQKVFEESMLLATDSLAKMLSNANAATSNLCLAGGCALNCPTNTRLANESRFTQLYVPPGCDDSGLPVGAALFLYHTLLDQPRDPSAIPSLANPYPGRSFSADQVDAALLAAGEAIVYTRCEDAPGQAAAELAAGAVIGWYDGGSEIGPRALGHRSILADPRHAEHWKGVNQIKRRESWRPFAPAVLAEHAADWFRGTPLPSPYMLFTATVRTAELPAITHADGSARIQTVDVTCGRFHQLLTCFHELTDVPVLLNTSFNGPGEPIVESPADALRCFLQSELNALYLHGFRVVKKT